MPVSKSRAKRIAEGKKRQISTKSETAVLVKRLVREHGLDPLTVMLDNMSDAHAKAVNLSSKKDKQSKIEFNRQMARAQHAAAEAAPYVHPKLASTVLKGDKNAPVIVNIIDDID